MASADKIINDIKNLKIQGARNVAKAALHALSEKIKSSRAKTPGGFYSELKEFSDALAASRPTEPMMRNNLNEIIEFALTQLKSGKKTVRIKKLNNVKKAIIGKEDALLKRMEENFLKITEYGARLVPDGAVILTHCHSSTVTGIFKIAHKLGKNISVIACETRPLFQGRITARELAEAGIPVTLVVDSAMNAAMKKADLCIIGADAVTSRGDLINKIGTATLAHVARIHDVSFYSAAELFKYSPATLFGEREKIEERNPKEIWESPPKGVKIQNQAFDVTAARYITGYITEAGIISPFAWLGAAEKTRHAKF